MHLLQVVSILLGFIMASSALPKAPVANVAQNTGLSDRVIFADFQISNMILLTSALPDNLTFNHTLSFNFTDPNSNGTNTICGSSWITTTNGGNTAPMSYILCDRTADKGFFEWQFTTITSLTSFGLRFAHEFSDPVHYPPPYDMVVYFSDANVTLTCDDETGTSCELPSMNATINRISN
ncbi:hypothetical protein BGZ57DRAFT_588374 [Hyaloscypha finlandica]|nr:hypothetical protein F5882DRAFT_138001 [Hyaloscypha sp. PMI_1271]KAH8791431.1 hypothetical protein BGZ57DRAFT_588374 [Hyaloscypha finlandica]